MRDNPHYRDTKSNPSITDSKKPRSCMDQFDRYPESEPMKDDWIDSFIARLYALLHRADRTL